MKRLLLLLLLIPNLTFGQGATQQQVLNAIASNLPTNNANQISALLLRNTLNLMTSAIFAPSTINITTNISGLIPFEEYCASLCINIPTDTAAAGLGVNAILINENFGGSTVTGTRTGGLVILTQTAPTNPSNPFPAYTGWAPAVITSGLGDGGTDTGNGAKGTYFGENPQVRSSATNVYQLTGSESDVFGTAAATQRFQLGYSAVAIFVNNATALDAAYEIHAGVFPPYGSPTAPGPGFKFGLVAAEPSGGGYVPISPTGTFIGTYLTSLSTIPVLNVIDIRGFTPSGSQIVGTNFSIDPSGNAQVASLSSTFTATFGINGTVGGLLAVANGGASGAFAEIQNPSATSNYNFNLPATAGITGQVLTSAGGGSAAMTWTQISGVYAPLASPTFTGTVTTPNLTVTTTFTATGLVTNADLANPSTTVNTQTCTLGSSCTVTAAAGTLTGTTLNSTVVTSSLTTVGTLGSLTVTGNVTSGNHTFTTAAATVSAAQIGLGSTTVAAGASNCPTGTVGGSTVQGCMVINVAGTQRVVPFF